MSAVDLPRRQVRASYDETSIVVYQAYPSSIADAALETGRLTSPFKFDRMTWIKPSFLWMMYRSGWATKPGQERVLAIRITRDGFDEALRRACPSQFEPRLDTDRESWQARLKSSSVRVQWDPERSPTLNPLPWRAIQIGLSGDSVREYVHDWTIGITDLTPTVQRLRAMDSIQADELPIETPYPLSREIAATIDADG